MYGSRTSLAMKLTLLICHVLCAHVSRVNFNFCLYPPNTYTVLPQLNAAHICMPCMGYNRHIIHVTAAGGCTLKAARSELKRDWYKVPTYSTYYVCYT